MLRGSKAGWSALLLPGMRLDTLRCIFLSAMSFVENFATSIASDTVSFGAFRRVFTAISNLASNAALFFDMLRNSVYSVGAGLICN
jgi:hypothetical protein